MLRREPRTKREIYMDYLIYGGDMRALPEPSTAEDLCWMRLCQIGFGLPQHVAPYVQATLNSDSGNSNFVGGIFDLGEQRITGAKVRFRFTLRQGSGTSKPTTIGAVLYANNNVGRDILTGGYSFNFDNKIPNPEYEKEYTLDVSYDTQGNGRGATNLNNYRYLKPFLKLTKTNPADANREEKHILDIHEISIVIGNTIYNLTDTARDFVPKEGSDVRFIKPAISLGSIQSRRAPWYGLKANCLGDSITFGLHPNPTSENKKTGAAVTNPWATQLRDYCGFAHVRNYGLSGNRISGGATPMHTRVAGMSQDADLVVVSGATNDLSNGVALGTFKAEDTTLDVNTFYGGLQELCKKLKERFPNKPIVFMTPLNGTNNNIPNGVHPVTKLTIEDYKKAIREVINHYDLILFELQDNIEFDAFVEADRTKYIDDGVHPNQLGHDHISDVVSYFLNTQVRPLIAA